LRSWKDHYWETGRWLRTPFFSWNFLWIVFGTNVLKSLHYDNYWSHNAYLPSQFIQINKSIVEKFNSYIRWQFIKKKFFLDFNFLKFWIKKLKIRTILAPIMTRPNSIWSNVWGDVDSNGFYLRSDDYIDIVQNRKK